MTDVFKSYTPTIRKLLQQDDKDLSLAFIDENIEEILQDHDNWNGGIDSYLIKVNVPIKTFYNLKKNSRIKETEDKITGYYRDMLKGDDSIILNEVAICPSDNGLIDFGNNNDDSMWKPGYFRLFISHLSENKDSASGLKEALTQYGIDCFVAHEDIRPSKEWEIEIENALYTTDALCAIVVPEFRESIWCDQEVGIALGQHKMVFSIDKGFTPYGFFGKFQAIKSKDKTRKKMAYDVWSSIINNDNTKNLYSEKFIYLLLNVNTEENAVLFLQHLQDFKCIAKKYIEILYSHYSENKILMKSTCLIIANKVFSNFDLTQKEPTTKNTTTLDNDDDLPF